MDSTSPPDSERIHAAYEKVCRVLLDRKMPEGHWVGRLSDSALSTATAVSALVIHDADAHQTPIRKGVEWLLNHQNADGGWGDTDKSVSNVSTTLLVKSALNLAMQSIVPISHAEGVKNVPSPFGGGFGWGQSERQESPHPPYPINMALPEGEGTLQNADSYLAQEGVIAAIRKRYGKDQTFSVPILTNAALAGLVEWKDVPQLPFELAALPMSWFRFVKMNVVSYAIPALVAIGQVRFHFSPEKGKIFGNFCRRLVKKRTLRLIQDMQPESGGYLEAAPLTSFVVMSLSAMGLREHPVVTKGIRFLLETVRGDGSWAIDTNLATWLTSLSLTAMQDSDNIPNEQTIDWLLSCQHKQRHPFTGASPGGWGWTNLSGAVPDADDTSAALLALFQHSGQNG